METVEEEKKLHETVVLKGDTVLVKRDPSLSGSTPEIEITPYVCKTVSSYVLCIKQYDNLRYYDASKRNLFAFWRAIQILQSLKTISHGSLFRCFSASFHGEIKKSYVESLISEIGLVKYKEIMAKKIPDEVIQIVFNSQKEKRNSLILNLNSFADEFKNKTIRYHDYEEIFTSLGVKKVF